MKVKTLVEWSGVPKGTTATCIIEPKPNWTKKKIWKVTWDLDRKKPLVDWFDKEEFEKWLVVINV